MLVYQLKGISKTIMFKKTTIKKYSIHFCLFFILKNIYNCSLTNVEKMSLINLIGIPDYLKKVTLITRTNLAPIRSILSLPLSINYQNKEIEPKELSLIFTPFYSGINNGIYVADGKKEYTDVIDLATFTPRHFSEDFYDLIAKAVNIKGVNFPLLGNLFDEIIINQQRLGTILKGNIKYNNYIFSIDFPILYQINYPFINPEIQERITDELTILIPSKENVTKDDAAEFFIKKHAVVDFFGIDEICFSIKKTISEKKYFAFLGDIGLTIPINCTFKKGLIGGDFSSIFKKKSYFLLSNFIENIIPNSSNENPCYKPEKGKEELYLLFSDMLDRVTDSFYNLSFDRRHIYITPKIEFVFIPKDYFQFIWNMSFGFGINRTYTTYGTIQTPKNAFNQDFQNNNLAEKSIIFLDDQLIKHLLPVPLKSLVKPGIQFHSQYLLYIEDPYLSITTGFDGWYKLGDKIIPEFHSDLGTHGEKIFFTKADSSFQLQYLAQLKAPIKIKDSLFEIGVSGFFTLISSGIGKESGLSLLITKDY